MMHSTPGHLATMNFGFQAAGAVYSLAILALFILIVWWITKSTSKSKFTSSPKESAEDILKRRLASGELTLSEYRNLRSEIGLPEDA